MCPKNGDYVRRSALIVFVYFLVWPAFVTFADDDLGKGGSNFNVGMLLPLSGSYAAIGSDTRQGIEVALSELGDSPLSRYVEGERKKATSSRQT